jgi:hypothetical protein
LSLPPKIGRPIQEKLQFVEPLANGPESSVLAMPKPVV